MGESLLEVAVSGLALGGVLAVGGAWSRVGRRGAVPHLGVGATAGVAVMLAHRLADRHAVVVLLAMAVAGVVVGDVLFRLDRRVRLAVEPDVGAPSPSLLPEVAVLAAAIALADLLRPALAIPLPFGPLGGRPGPAAGITALLVGVVAAWLLVGRPASAPSTWRIAGAATVVAATLAGASLGAPGAAFLALPTVVDTAGLAFRVFAAGVLGRSGPLHAAAAGVALGVAEALLWLAAPVGWLGALPAVAAAAAGLLVLRDPRSRLGAGASAG